MTILINAILGLIEFIISIVNLIISVIDSCVWLVMNLPQLLASVTTAFAYAPAFVEVFLVCSLAIIVVMFVIRLVF